MKDGCVCMLNSSVSTRTFSARGDFCLGLCKASQGVRSSLGAQLLQLDQSYSRSQSAEFKRFLCEKKSFKNINSSADFKSRITVQEKRVGKTSEKFSKVQLGVQLPKNSVSEIYLLTYCYTPQEVCYVSKQVRLPAFVFKS